jgi:hypothetical protein
VLGYKLGCLQMCGISGVLASSYAARQDGDGGKPGNARTISRPQIRGTRHERPGAGYEIGPIGRAPDAWFLWNFALWWKEFVNGDYPQVSESDGIAGCHAVGLNAVWCK